jgi:hypothetical protein
LTDTHIVYLAAHMKTTLNIDDSVMAELKREATRRECTMSEFVEFALRLLLQTKSLAPDLPLLPTFRGDGELVDISDRNALYQAMESR